MSCHNIGRGLNEIGKVFDFIYENGGLSKEDYKTMIRSLRNAARCCDGIECEAIEYIIEPDGDNEFLRCGRCLNKVNVEEAISLTTLDGEVDGIKKDYAYLDVSCPDCYEKYVKPRLNKRQIQGIRGETKYCFGEVRYFAIKEG